MSDLRENILLLVKEAQASGARQAKACAAMGISTRTIQR